MKKDLENYLEENLEDMAEDHIEVWKDRYWRKSLTDIEFDLKVNHDDSLEIEGIEDGLGRKLTDKEKKLISGLFIEKVVEIFYE